MALHRGLAGLCIVLALAWVAFALTHGADDIKSSFKALTSANPNIAGVEVGGQTGNRSSETPPAANARTSAETQSQESPGSRLLAIGRLGVAFGFAVIPPLTLFALVMIGRWVVSGFRRKAE